MALALKANHFRNRSDSAVPDRANIVRLYISSRRKSRTRRRSGKGTDPEVQTERSFFSALGQARQPQVFLLSIIDRLVSCGSACAIDFCFPNDGGMMRLCRAWHCTRRLPSASRPLRFHTINARGRTLQHD
jgi:hypothetical protein